MVQVSPVDGQIWLVFMSLTSYLYKSCALEIIQWICELLHFVFIQQTKYNQNFCAVHFSCFTFSVFFFFLSLWEPSPFPFFKSHLFFPNFTLVFGLVLVCQQFWSRLFWRIPSTLFIIMKAMLRVWTIQPAKVELFGMMTWTNSVHAQSPLRMYLNDSFIYLMVFPCINCSFGHLLSGVMIGTRRPSLRTYNQKCVLV